MNKVVISPARCIMKKFILRRLASSYQDAVCSLNELQTPSDVLKKIAESGGRDYSLQFQKSQRYTQLAGLEEEHLNSLNVIHISGTKGKGSTGAFCESILRQCGLKTGFFSSPHLMEVRERIRINGRPLPQDKFATFFHHCFNIFNVKKELMGGELPGYFRFLTIMAFYTFLEEQVDVSIVETGMGGEYDPTNVIRRPVVCGVTLLDYDHVQQLGHTLGEIAWHKAGIFKPGRPAYTVPQEREAMQVIHERSCQNRVCSLNVVPHWDQYPMQQLSIGLPGEHQKINASLALQLCRRWLIETNQVKDCLPDSNGSARPSQGVSTFSDGIPAPFRDGIENCRWPGRHQVVYRDHVTYYLDGAHTGRSAQACSDWFKSAANKETPSGQMIRVLLFNLTGDRHFETILNTLKDCEFQYAFFCPNVVNKNQITGGAWPDMTNLTVDSEEQFTKCKDFEKYWKEINPSSETAVLSSVEEVVNWINQYRERSGSHIQVLVCGSLHLVGAVMVTLNLTADNLCEL